MAAKKTTKKQGRPWLIPTLVLSVFAVLIGGMVKMVLLDGGSKPQKQIQVITLIKPPPEVKEKLPEPQVPKEAPKQSIETPSEAPSPQDQSQDNADDSPPAGDNLSVDGDGGAGDNAFGLGAKKGGRAITLGGNGGGGGGNGMNRLSLLSKYGGYSRRMQNDIEKKVKQVLEKEGGRPKGKQQTLIKLTLAQDGSVLKYSIVGTSGVDRLDAAFKSALNGLRMSEPPPDGMPSTMTLRITTQG
jgi:periplasmic protein TonB